MKIAVVAVLALGLSASAQAAPGGCLKYGAAGAVAGHYVGSGHTVAGALAGCAAGAWRRHEARKQEREQEEGRAADQRHLDTERRAYPVYREQHPNREYPADPVGGHGKPPPM